MFSFHLTHSYPPMALAGIAGLGPWELGIVLVIVMVVFGAGKLPTIGSSLGEAIKNFKKGIKSDDSSTTSQDKKKLE